MVSNKSTIGFHVIIICDPADKYLSALLNFNIKLSRPEIG